MRTRNLLMIGLATLAATACGSAYEAPPAKETAQQSAPAAAATMPGVPPGTGPVLETMNSGGYSYVRVDLGGKETWAAGPQTTVAVGDVVTLPQGMPMNGFESKTLGRTFEVVYFVGSIDVAGSGKITQDLGGSERSHAASAGVAAGSIAKVDGGQTVEEIVNGAADLSGKDIAVRGRVVKFNAQIMGTNWLHIQDGTGDLTVTTPTTVAVGDTVVVRGKVTTDKDFGAGYVYAVIVENAEVVKE